MNPARFGEWELDQVEALVALGTPREAAMKILRHAKEDAVREARAAEDDRQFVLQYQEVGSSEMGRRNGRSREWARRRFVELISQENSQEKLAHELRRA